MHDSDANHFVAYCSTDTLLLRSQPFNQVQEVRAQVLPDLHRPPRRLHLHRSRRRRAEEALVAACRFLPHRTCRGTQVKAAIALPYQVMVLPDC